MALETRVHDARRAGPFLGGAATLGFEDAKHVLHLRSGALVAGYHFAGRGVFGGEVGGEMGVGEPFGRDFSGPGFYGGVRGTALTRLWGKPDDERVHQILSPLFDLALQGKCGVWAAPEGSRDPVVPEASITLGVRLTLSTDLLHSPRREDNDVLR
jgi:hypothetical protein